MPKLIAGVVNMPVLLLVSGWIRGMHNSEGSPSIMLVVSVNNDLLMIIFLLSHVKYLI